MKLYCAAPSPFARKVLAAAMELGLDSQLEKIVLHTTPVEPNERLNQANPLKKIPALVLDDGTMLYDSGVICEYLDSVAGGGRLIPASGAARWQVKRQEALADGLLDAAVITRYELALRPEERRWDKWIAAQKDKIASALGQMEREIDDIGDAVTLGAVGFGCALGYLDFRFGDDDWRAGHPKLAAWYEAFGARPSMTATAPPA